MKSSFRGQKHRVQAGQHKSTGLFKFNDKSRKHRTRNANAKAKDSLEYDLDHVLSDHSFEHGENEPSSHDFMNFYNPETGLDRMHSSPVDDRDSTQVREPHLKFDYMYDNRDSRSKHKKDHRVDSYAGEMIDDENTLSKFIAPPVFENNQNRHKTHQAQLEKALYGTPEAENAENSNTKSFLQRLGSLMSPLPSSDHERKEIQGDEDQDGQSRNSIEYNGLYDVMNHRQRNDGNQDEENSRRDYERKDNDNIESNFNRDEESSILNRRHGSKEDYRNGESPSNQEESPSNQEDEHRSIHDDKSFDNDAGNSYEDNSHFQDSLRENNDNMGETRSSRYHEHSKSDGYPSEDSKADGYPSEHSKSDGYPSELSKSDGYPSEHSKSDGYPSENSKSDRYPSENSKSDGFPSELSKSDGFPSEHSKSDGYLSEHSKPDGYTSEDSNSDSSERYHNDRDSPYDKHGMENEEDKSRLNEHSEPHDKTIEMMQDDSGKLHSLTDNVNGGAIGKEIESIMSHDQQNKVSYLSHDPENKDS